MIRLIQYELQRAWFYKSFWCIFIISVCMALFSSIISSVNVGEGILPNIGVEIDEVTNITDDMECSVFDVFVMGIGEHLLTLISIFVSFFIASEFGHGTFKNIITRGYDKKDVYFAKVLGIFIVVTVVSITCSVVYFIGLSIFQSFSPNDVSFWEFIMIFMVKVLAFLALSSLVCMIAIISKNAAIAVGVSIIITRIVPALLSTFITATGNNSDFFNKYELTSLISSISVASVDTFNISIHAVWVCVIYIASTTCIGILIFKKRNL